MEECGPASPAGGTTPAIKIEPSDDTHYQNNTAIQDDEIDGDGADSEDSGAPMWGINNSTNIVKVEPLSPQHNQDKEEEGLVIGSIKRAAPCSITKERLKKKLKSRSQSKNDDTSKYNETNNNIVEEAQYNSIPAFEKRYTCVCNEQFPTHIALKTHVYTNRCPLDVNEIMDVMPNCMLCGACVPTSVISRHIEACRKERPVPCTVCGQGFGHMKQVADHLQAAHWSIWEQVSSLVRAELASMLSGNIMPPTIMPAATFMMPYANAAFPMQMPLSLQNIPNMAQPFNGSVSAKPRPIRKSKGTSKKSLEPQHEDPKSPLGMDAGHGRELENVKNTATKVVQKIVPRPGRKPKRLDSLPLEKRKGSTGDEDSGVENTSLASENLGSPSEASSTPSADNPESPSSHSEESMDLRIAHTVPILSAMLDNKLSAPAPPQGLECTPCGFRFKNQEEYVVHVMKCNLERPYCCRECGRGFAKPHYLDMHIRKTHTPSSCKVCGLGFRDESELDHHMRSHVDDRPFKCDHCGKGFNHASDRTRHMRIHTGEKPYTCKDCGKGFTDSSNYINHKRIHTGEKPYKCDYCPKRFTFSSAKTSHMRTHTGERPYQCNVCQKSFTMAHCLTRHMKSQHVQEQHARLLEEKTATESGSVGGVTQKNTFAPETLNLVVSNIKAEIE